MKMTKMRVMMKMRGMMKMRWVMKSEGEREGGGGGVKGKGD